MNVILSIDQSTQSTKLIFFDEELKVLHMNSLNHEQKCSKPGWYEHDPEEIIENLYKLMNEGMSVLKEKYKQVVIKCIGITNQRETVIIWDKETGKPLYNAIVWLDTRVEKLVTEFSKKYNNDYFQKKTGTYFNTYFSAFKILWLIKNNKTIKDKVKNGTAMIGNINTWLIYNLTKGNCYTDVTNASRTLLMDIKTLQWDPEMCKMFGISNMSSLPEIKSNCYNFGSVKSEKVPEYLNVPISGCIGDQQSACIGQAIFDEGEAKCTYGTGVFLLVNTGKKIVYSSCGLITTVCYKFNDDDKPNYALEGSIGTAGSGVSWLENVNLVKNTSEVSEIMENCKDTEGVVFVPAFGGLFAPRWRSDARACISGMSFNTSRAHIVRALLEGIVFQLSEIVNSLTSDMNIEMIHLLRCDGGMTKNKAFMQFNADILNTQIEVSKYEEVTALGAAVLAGLGIKLWKDLDSVKSLIRNKECTFNSNMDSKSRSKKMKEWNKAVNKELLES
ncbi:glycerol kinase, putative [Plasmodium vinckei vinckei]|uniref:glycerol kinase n=1 Tax=Plasmodium vinckei vinckei TaxID=54757 RepID=A0A449BZC2_PLAVN|nr:glycerol kinase, putative [Plasmodium vinckei vinckei]KEG05080.1 glycerol kinase [Plasmodium vinckei vinckei]VEV58732.1 glycerol kinase, putative [Plasmodium vinckei vinckei]